jgi:hypothetical protein
MVAVPLGLLGLAALLFMASYSRLGVAGRGRYREQETVL